MKPMEQARLCFWGMSPISDADVKGFLRLPGVKAAKSIIYPNCRLTVNYEEVILLDDGVTPKYTRTIANSLDLLCELKWNHLILFDEEHPDIGRIRSYVGYDLSARIFTPDTFEEIWRGTALTFPWDHWSKPPFGFVADKGWLFVNGVEMAQLHSIRSGVLAGQPIDTVARSHRIPKRKVQQILKDPRYKDGTVPTLERIK